MTELKAIPIPMTAHSVRAILAGNKTHTRRMPGKNDAVKYQQRRQLWVKEPFLQSLSGCTRESGEYQSYWTAEKFEYVADGATPHFLHPERMYSAWMSKRNIRFMPKIASRILLEVEDSWQELLQHISEEDAIAEGIEPLFTPEEAATIVGCNMDPMPWKNYLWHGLIGKHITGAQSDAWDYQYSSYQDPRGSFSSLWQSINGKRVGASWFDNPTVTVVRFKVVEVKENK